MSAELSAPPATTLNNRSGMRKAAKYASSSGLRPNCAPITATHVAEQAADHKSGHHHDGRPRDLALS
jgi:hypothetical protein